MLLSIEYGYILLLRLQEGWGQGRGGRMCDLKLKANVGAGVRKHHVVWKLL